MYNEIETKLQIQETNTSSHVHNINETTECDDLPLYIELFTIQEMVCFSSFDFCSIF